MFPLRLKIQGIYSYNELQEIDFQKLTSAHLFGIFGQTGSGKSTVLEAITFSLFGECERLNSRDNRAYNMMNLKCAASLIEFDFEAPGGQIYKAKVEGKRNRNKFEDVKFERKLYRKEDGGYLPIEMAEIETILKIDYQNFKRTSIIPQGKFQEFLQLSPKERNVMLMELFNLQKFDLQNNASALLKKTETEIAETEARIGQIGEISQENLDAKKNECQQLLQVLSDLEKELQQQRAQDLELARLEALFREWNTQKEQFAVLQHQEKAVSGQELRIKNYETCFFQFKNELDQKDRNEFQIGELTLSIEKSKQELAASESALLVAATDLAEAQKAFENRNDLKQKAGQLQNILQLAGLLQKTQQQQKRIEAGNRVLEEKKQAKARLSEQIREVENRMAVLRREQPNSVELQKASEWFQQNGLLQTRLSEIRKNHQTLESEIAEIRQKIRGWAVKYALEPQEDLKSGLQSRKETLQARRQTLSETLQHWAVQQRLHEFASRLADGQPCPLCGSLEHPHVVDIQNVEKEVQTAQAGQSDLEAALKAVSDDWVALQHTTELLEKKQASEKQLLVEIEKLQNELESHQRLFIWKDWNASDESLLTREWKKFHEIQEQLALQDTQLKQLQLQGDENERNIATYSEAIYQIEKEVSGDQKLAEAIRNQIPPTEFDEYSGKPHPEIQDEINRLEALYVQSGQQFAHLQRLRDEWLQKTEASKAALAHQTRQWEEIRQQQQQLLERWQQKITQSPFENEAAVRQILAQPLDLENEKRQIQDFRNAFTALDVALQKTQAQIGTARYDEAEHARLRAELAVLEANVSKQHQEKGRLENEWQRLQADWEQSRLLTAKRSDLQQRQENIKLLFNLFKGQAFVNYVSRVHLQNLTRMANERFYKLTRQQLQLELDEENNFIIRDYLNENQLRSVKTLSGGQLFQASLCLALALTDNIQQQNRNGQSFFFLDEGFGTLDSESLALVYETLKSLRYESRIVGIISHVNDLQQEIGVWLQINQTETKGSQITTSWD